MVLCSTISSTVTLARELPEVATTPGDTLVEVARMPAVAVSPNLRLPLHGRRFTPRQEEVLDALEDVFFHDGLHVTVEELARRASCSRRTLYELAPSKEELFLLALDRMLRRLGGQARAAAAGQRTPETRLKATLAASVAAFQPVGLPFAEAIESYGPAGWLYEYHLALIRGTVTEMVDDGIRSGEFNELHPELVAEVLIAATRRLADPHLLDSWGVSAAEALEELYRLTVDGLVKQRRDAT